MGKQFVFVSLLVVFLSILHPSEQLQSSQAQTLLRIQRLLNNPPVLSSWNDDTDFCNLEPNSSLTVTCYERSVTQLRIIGSTNAPPLPESFSMDSFVTTLVRLPNLKVLTLASLGLWGPLSGKIARLSSLEIFNVSSNFINGSIPHELSSLTGLQTLILDGNMFVGPVPDFFRTLTVLSLRRNSFNGSLPASFSGLETLRVLALSHNRFYGKVPDLSALTNLQVLDLEDNAFTGEFPRVGNKVTTLILKHNQFRSGIPGELSSFYQLQQLDLSFNSFVGPFPQTLLALPSINYINIAGNKFTGMMLENQSCNDDLLFVDLSSNLLTGKLPDCLSKSNNTNVFFSRNCLSDPDKDQQPLSFCHNQALAVGIVPDQKKGSRDSSKTAIILGVVGGVVGGIALVVLGFFVVRKVRANPRNKTPPTRLISENASSTGYTSKLFTDARYIYQTMKLGALGLPGYRTFSLEELEEATHNFDTSAFMGEGSQGQVHIAEFVEKMTQCYFQMYKGQLKNGSMVSIRCLKMKKSQDIQNFMHHIELISKLRHRHVASALGHCFECYWDDSSVSRIFLVFEYVPNGTLRSWISGRRSRQLLSWSQRITAAIGVARGIQFLHTGIVPGLYANNLKITDVLLDQNLVAKISSYNLPLLGQDLCKDGKKSSGSKDITRFQLPHAEKSDIYDFGVILLELIVGRPFNSKGEIDAVINQLQSSVSPDGSFRRSFLDPTVDRACTDESLKTVMEICIRCVQNNPTERPSVEDVVWNLQFAAQVQDAWRDSHSTEGSPGSPTQRPRLSVTMR